MKKEETILQPVFYTKFSNGKQEFFLNTNVEKINISTEKKDNVKFFNTKVKKIVKK